MHKMMGMHKPQDIVEYDASLSSQNLSAMPLANLVLDVMLFQTFTIFDS